ncbi:hypothetical protein AAMO2058_000102000 [Amorphochlora amoebiformis]
MVTSPLMGEGQSSEERFPSFYGTPTPTDVSTISQVLDLEGRGRLHFRKDRLRRLIQKVKWPPELERFKGEINSKLDEADWDSKTGPNEFKTWLSTIPLPLQHTRKLILALGRAKQELLKEEMLSVEGILSRANLMKYTKTFRESKVSREELLRSTTKETEDSLMKRTGLKQGHMVRLRRVLKDVTLFETKKPAHLLDSQFYFCEPSQANLRMYRHDGASDKFVTALPTKSAKHHLFRCLQENSTLSTWTHEHYIFREFEVKAEDPEWLFKKKSRNYRGDFIGIGVAPLEIIPGNWRYGLPERRNRGNTALQQGFEAHAVVIKGKLKRSKTSKRKALHSLTASNRILSSSSPIEGKISLSPLRLSLLIDVRSHQMLVFANGVQIRDGLSLPLGVEKTHHASIFFHNYKSELRFSVLPSSCILPSFAKNALTANRKMEKDEWILTKLHLMVMGLHASRVFYDHDWHWIDIFLAILCLLVSTLRFLSQREPFPSTRQLLTLASVPMMLLSTWIALVARAAYRRLSDFSVISSLDQKDLVLNVQETCLQGLGWSIRLFLISITLVGGYLGFYTPYKYDFGYNLTPYKPYDWKSDWREGFGNGWIAFRYRSLFFASMLGIILTEKLFPSIGINLPDLRAIGIDITVFAMEISSASLSIALLIIAFWCHIWPNDDRAMIPYSLDVSYSALVVTTSTAAVKKLNLLSRYVDLDTMVFFWKLVLSPGLLILLVLRMIKIFVYPPKREYILLVAMRSFALCALICSKKMLFTSFNIKAPDDVFWDYLNSFFPQSVQDVTPR